MVTFCNTKVQCTSQDTGTYLVKMESIFIITKDPSRYPLKIPLLSQPQSLNSWQILNLFSISINMSFKECYINGIIMYVMFGISFFTLHNSLEIHPGFAVYINSLFLFLTEWHAMIWIIQPFKNIWVVSSLGALWI